jgi:hypothetical protein
LCDAALPKVNRAARWLPVTVEVVDITSDSDLEAEYHLRIPVVLDRKGRVVAEGRISAGRALAGTLLGLR